jgi:hypothetical protein
VTQYFDEHNSAFSQTYYPLGNSNAIADSHLDPNFQLPDFAVYNGVDGAPDRFANSASLAAGGNLTATDPLEGLTDFDQLPLSAITGMPNWRASSNLHPPWDDLTAINPQENFTGFNQLLHPTTPGMSCAFPGFAPKTSWDDLTAINSQGAMTSLNQFPSPTTTGMFPSLAIPAQATDTFTAPSESLPIPRGVISRSSNVYTNKHTCDNGACRKSFSRPSDLTRHKMLHGLAQYRCTVNGCKRHAKAFHRFDKLREHQRKIHRMGV